MTAGAIRLRKGPALDCTWGKRIRIAIGHACSGEERNGEDKQALGHDVVSLFG
jgi:hypothetical protein